MATPPATPAARSDFGSLPTEAIQAAYETPRRDAAVTENRNDDQPVAATGINQKANTSKPKPTFARRKLLGNSSLFLLPQYRGFFTDHMVEIVGRIIE